MSSSVQFDRYDVVVAGARCAGASTAMLLARGGLRVLVVDPLPRGRDTLSTHAVMRAGVLQLHRWGLLEAVRAAGTPPVRATTFHYAWPGGTERVRIDLEPRDGLDALYAPRRTVLDPILAEAAEEAGAEVVHGVAVVDLVRGPGGRVQGVVIEGADRLRRTIGAEWVVGADGLRSRVARQVGAPGEHEARYAAAAVYGYWPGIEPDGYHWYFAPAAGAGTIPTNDGLTCVSVSIPRERFETERSGGLDALHAGAVREAAPELAAALEGVPPIGGLRAFAGMPGFLRRSVGPGWALVGDAGYFKDPFTAHGITDALRDAELLADAIRQGTEESVRGYPAARDAVSTDLMELTDRICSFDWTLEELQGLHRRLSRAMNAGLDLVRTLGEPPSGPAPHPRRSHVTVEAEPGSSGAPADGARADRITA